MESSEQNSSSISQNNLPHKATFLQVGLPDAVLSKYPNKPHNFTNLILMTSSL